MNEAQWLSQWKIQVFLRFKQHHSLKMTECNTQKQKSTGKEKSSCEQVPDLLVMATEPQWEH